MKKLFVLVLALSFATPAFALTLKEKKQVQAWNDYLKDESQSYVKSFKDKCGYDLPVTMEEKFATPFMEANTNAASYCDSPRSAMSGMCEDATSKDSIAKQVKKVDCKLGEKGKVNIKLTGTTLTFTVGVEAANLDDAVKTFLEK